MSGLVIHKSGKFSYYNFDERHWVRNLDVNSTSRESISRYLSIDEKSRLLEHYCKYYRNLMERSRKSSVKTYQTRKA